MSTLSLKLSNEVKVKSDLEMYSLFAETLKIEEQKIKNI